MKTLGIIPARYASTRFPGKPLALIGKESMIQHVYKRASASKIDKVVVATDDERIFNHVKSFNGEALMTSEKHKSGTSRCAEAAEKIGGNFNLVFNIQGDEPFIDPGLLNQMILSFNKSNDDIVTPIKLITENSELHSHSKVKVIRDSNSHALYFSRQPIPFIRETEPGEWYRNFAYYLHVGIYAFRIDVLFDVVHLPQSGLELAESLEQLTWLYHGYKIKVMETEYNGISIDTPEDLQKANWLI